MSDKYISERAQKVDASGIRRVFALGASLEDPINFSIGQPEFDVPGLIKDAAIQAIRDGENKYSQTAGTAELREKVAGKISDEFGWENPGVLISCGVSGGLMLAFMTLVNPGDEVITTDPYFVAYKHMVNMVGGRCVFVDTYPDFGLPVDKIAAAITDKTKLIVVNSPSNPTGVVYTDEQVRKLAEVAAEREIIVITDEIYERFCYDGACASVASYYDKSLVLRGFSKAYGMTGWRLGYVAAHEVLADVIDEMAKMQQYTFVCGPTPFQAAGLVALDCDVSDYVDLYRKKRDMVYEGLKDKFELVRPGGAFYAFVKAPGGCGTEFVERAIANNVLAIPGNVFSERDSHFRISYATSEEKILRGLEILRSLA
ncbi:MAG: pyridoxal phosphate-dependent aminotransferase [Planctomycetota bacterium]|jgi:aspartate aminotransferase/aminotransferase